MRTFEEHVSDALALAGPAKRWANTGPLSGREVEAFNAITAREFHETRGVVFVPGRSPE